jgi:metal-responsive CopG/Arc/MetJ family transcriptional regulator
MKSKASITLSVDLLEELDAMVREKGNRSLIIEKALREYMDRVARTERDRRDLEILNRTAKRMASETRDALRYQVKQ